MSSRVTMFRVCLLQPNSGQRRSNARLVRNSLQPDVCEFIVRMSAFSALRNCVRASNGVVTAGQRSEATAGGHGLAVGSICVSLSCPSRWASGSTKGTTGHRRHCR